MYSKRRLRQQGARAIRRCRQGWVVGWTWYYWPIRGIMLLGPWLPPRDPPNKAFLSGPHDDYGDGDEKGTNWWHWPQLTNPFRYHRTINIIINMNQWYWEWWYLKKWWRGSQLWNTSHAQVSSKYDAAKFLACNPHQRVRYNFAFCIFYCKIEF